MLITLIVSCDIVVTVHCIVIVDQWGDKRAITWQRIIALRHRISYLGAQHKLRVITGDFVLIWVKVVFVGRWHPFCRNMRVEWSSRKLVRSYWPIVFFRIYFCICNVDISALVCSRDIRRRRSYLET
jgi:hypothetical protein